MPELFEKLQKKYRNHAGNLIILIRADLRTSLKNAGKDTIPADNMISLMQETSKALFHQPL